MTFTIDLMKPSTGLDEQKGWGYARVLLAGAGGTTNELIHKMVCDTHRQGGSGSGKPTWNPTTPTNNEKSINSEKGNQNGGNNKRKNNAERSEEETWGWA